MALNVIGQEISQENKSLVCSQNRETYLVTASNFSYVGNILYARTSRLTVVNVRDNKTKNRK